MERKRRTLIKGILYRILGTTLTFTVSYLITGSLPQASSITVVLFLLKFFIYLIYERIWIKIKWGKNKS